MNKWLLHIALILSTAHLAVGQAIAPDGATDWDFSHIAVSANGDQVYAITYDADNEYDLRHWDYGGWVDLGPVSFLPKHGLNPDGEFKVVDIIHYRNKVYVTGKYEIDLTGSAGNKVVVWDGSTWSVFNDTLITQSSDINKFLVYENQLVLVGMFGQGVTSNLLKLETDNSWSEYGSLLTTDNSADYFNDAVVNNGKIYASGAFTSPKLAGQRILASFNGEEWTIEGLAPFQTMADNFAIYDGSMVLYGEPVFSSYDYFKKLDGSMWTNISNGLEDIGIDKVNGMVQAGDYLWVTGIFTEISSSRLFNILYFNGSIWTAAETGEISSDLIPLALEKQPYIFGNFMYHEATNFGRIYPDRALLSGKVYHDVDQNCEWSSGDSPLPEARVIINPGERVCALNSDGSFHIPVPEGNYTISLLTPDYHITTCSEEVNLTVDALETFSGIDFGLKPIPGKVDLTGHITDRNGWVLKSGEPDNIRLCVYNKGTADASNVKVVMNLDSRLSNLTFSPQPDFQNTERAEWLIADIPAGSSRCFELTATIPGVEEGQINLGYDLIYDNDENSSDNKGATSFDLTDEPIDPIRKSSANGEEISLDQSYLFYKIRVHNVSNSTIERIVIRDTFDKGLYFDKTWFDYSFACQPVFKTEYLEAGDNFQWIYTWTWEKALLVDSSTHPLASVGYLDIKLRLFPGLHPKGTTVCNRAMVYLDDHEPYKTNEVCGTFGKLFSIDEISDDLLKLRPNPASDYIEIDNPVAEWVQVSIYTVEGQLVWQDNMSPLASRKISLNGLQSGVYVIRTNGIGAARFIIANR
jgi:hypothetical protein